MRVALLVGSVLAGLVSIEAAAQGQQDFTLVNQTGYTIEEVYVAPSESTDWEEDVLGQDTLGHGEELDISFHDRRGVCLWDVMVVYDDRETAEWNNFDLCQIARIRLHYDRKSGRTWAEYK